MMEFAKTIGLSRCRYRRQRLIRNGRIGAWTMAEEKRIYEQVPSLRGSKSKMLTGDSEMVKLRGLHV